MPSRMWICHLLLCCVWLPQRAYGEKPRDLKILDDLLKNYDRRAAPSELTGNATRVFVDIYLRHFGSINPVTMVRNPALANKLLYSSCAQPSGQESNCGGTTGAGTYDWKDYEADLYLYQRWTDERLMHQNLSDILYYSDPKIVQLIWKPDVFFPNAKEAQFQTVTVPNVVVRIHPGGEILYMLRLRLFFSCMMDLTKFPLDRQMCSIELASFAKTTRDLVLSWGPSHPVRIYEGVRLPQFAIEDVVTSHCVDSVETFHFGLKSCLRVDICLKRSLGFHLVESYLPTAIIVVVSWVSFWLEVDAIPARVTLGVTTLLTISSENAATRPNLPPVSYIKALDVWMGACTLFIFMALVEFTCVNYLSRRRKRRRGPKPKRRRRALLVGLPCSVEAGDSRTRTVVPNGHDGPSAIHQLALAKKIDRLSRVVFPVMYLLFNVTYWLYYML